MGNCTEEVKCSQFVALRQRMPSSYRRSFRRRVTTSLRAPRCFREQNVAAEWIRKEAEFVTRSEAIRDASMIASFAVCDAQRFASSNLAPKLLLGKPPRCSVEPQYRSGFSGSYTREGEARRQEARSKRCGPSTSRFFFIKTGAIELFSEVQQVLPGSQEPKPAQPRYTGSTKVSGIAMSMTFARLRC